MNDTIFMIADVHGNREALEAILEDARPGVDDWILCLGDVVGYGPDPGFCIDELRRRDARVIMGNHDAVVVGEMSPDYFNPLAREAALWSRARIDESQQQYLAERPRVLRNDWYECVHGSPRRPLEEYVHGESMARLVSESMSRPLLAVGHTHIPALYREQGSDHWTQERIASGERYSIDWETQKIILNPGSVGQPRDGDPRASYLKLQPERRTATWNRVPYDIPSVQEKMRRAELPEKLAVRLQHGA